MMDDFRPQRPGQPTNKPDGFQPAYNEQPETYEALPSAQVAPEPTESSPQTPKKKSGVKKWLLGGVVMLLLAGLGALAYWQWAEADSAKKELSSTHSRLETAQSALAKTKTDADKADESVTNEPTDKEQVIKIVTANAHASVSSEKHSVTVNVAKQNDKFVYTNVKVNNGSAGEYAEILKKVDEVWVTVYRGQEKPSQVVIDQYGIPAEFQFMSAQ